MNSIRRKLLLTLIGALSVVVLLAAWATYTTAREEANTIFDYHLEQIALSLRDQTFLNSTEAIADEKNFDFVIRVWDREGLSIYTSRPHRALPAIARLGYATETTSEGTWRIYAVQYLGQTIAVAQPLSVRSELAATAALHTLAPFGVLLPAIGLLIWFLVSRELRPLDLLAQLVSTRNVNVLTPFSETGIPEEVLPLVQALNDLLARLHVALQAQRDFIADAAHELRTPLTALQLQAQLLERSNFAEDRTAALRDLKKGLERTIHTVHQLLTLAREEPGAAGQAFSDVALADLTRQVVTALNQQAGEKCIDLGVDSADPSANVLGDRDALRTLLTNLVSNAVHYTPPGGRIDVRCGRNGSSVYLEVVDTGPGIPPVERERVFDRFYRRNGEDEGGSGLGLAIVRTIADRHGASIQLGDAPGGGLLVRVDFPPGAMTVDHNSLSQI